MQDYAKARETMVDRQVNTLDVTDPRILSAMREIPREVFLPLGLRPIAYSDADLPLRAGDGSTRYLSDPATLARLIQLVSIGENDVVLDVGCTTGYSTAIISRIANFVVGLEADEQLAANATSTLLELDIGNAAVVTGRLDEGYPAEAPYDVIILEGAVETVPATLTDQLKDGGRLVAVVGEGPIGVATVFTRYGQEVSHRRAFDVPSPILPGFAVKRGFVF